MIILNQRAVTEKYRLTIRSKNLLKIYDVKQNIILVLINGSTISYHGRMSISQHS
ncbi:MAG: hypothetical protein CM15mP4_1310 [Candidatus Neomarinimicrobiota bacterium]|nr:MAG: hypothetical protein CM15mP4_1310 [Candidatus Neomarinimicrobiota bacterium]